MAPSRRSLYENGFSSGYPRTRDDGREKVMDDRDGSDKERDGGDHGHDPRRQGGALKPEKEREKNKSAEPQKRKQEFFLEKVEKQRKETENM